MEQSFETLSEAISYVFRQEQTSLLSLDRICEVLSSPNLFLVSKNQGPVPCTSITRRRISSTLSSSELFIRAGPPRTCLWAIRPHNPEFISDGAIASSIEQMLTENGPMTLQEFVNRTELSGAHLPLFENFLREHKEDYSQDSEGKTWWFSGQPLPLEKEYETLCQAITSAFIVFPDGASVEELHWYLCLSKVGSKKITRRSISRELSRHQDLFIHLSRARYNIAPIPSMQSMKTNSLPIPRFTHFIMPTINDYGLIPPSDIPIHSTDSFENNKQPPNYPEYPPPIYNESENIDNSGNGPDFNPTQPDDDDFDPYNFFGRDFRFNV